MSQFEMDGNIKNNEDLLESKLKYDQMIANNQDSNQRKVATNPTLKNMDIVVRRSRQSMVEKDVIFRQVYQDHHHVPRRRHKLYKDDDGPIRKNII